MYICLVTLPDATNHHRSLMTDVTGQIRRTGEMNYNVPRGDAYARMRACVGKFIYLSETPERQDYFSSLSVCLMGGS